jgi:hypothetical protein
VGRVEYSRPAVASQPVRLMLRPTYLVGREELLAELDVRLAGGSGPSPQMVALCGLGGAGKTSVAVEYAYRHLGRFGAVWQLAADEPGGMAAGFGELAAQLGVRELLDSRDPVAQVHSVLAARPGDWLLILDNATNLTAVQDVLPPAGRGQVLITSQNPHWPGSQALDVPVLDKEVAAEFLIARTGSADEPAVRDLAAELGGLPLALEQAAAYMQATGRAVVEYLTLFRQRRADLLARGRPMGYSKQVATTWELAFNQLQQTAPLAIALLRLLACCAPDRIPFRLLLQAQPDLTSLLSEVAALLDDSLAADEAVTELRQFSLISAPLDGLVSVHRLVQAVTLDQLPVDQAQIWRRAAGTLIEAALPADPEQPGAWSVFARLLPHAQAALPAGAAGMARIAVYLGFSGSYTAALALQQQITAASQEAFGAEHAETLIARANLAFWTGAAGDPAAARDQFAALLPVVERVSGPEDPGTLLARANLAQSTGQAGDPAAARDQFAALLPVVERVFGTEHRHTLTVRGNLAQSADEAGDPVAARNQFAALLPLSERIHGAQHPATLGRMSDFAFYEGAAGNAEAARDMFGSLLPHIEQIYGAEHPDTLIVRGNLARWTGAAGDPAAARDQFAALLPVRERVSGPEHPETLLARANLDYWTQKARERESSAR